MRETYDPQNQVSRPHRARSALSFPFNKADWSHLKYLFKHSPWNLVLAGEDINNIWTMWNDVFFAAVNDCIPKYKQKRKTKAPCITKDLIKLSRKKKNLNRKAKKSGREEAWAT